MILIMSFIWLSPNSIRSIYSIHTQATGFIYEAVTRYALGLYTGAMKRDLEKAVDIGRYFRCAQGFLKVLAED